MTAHYQIQDSAFVAHCADGSRSADLPQYYPAPYGPSPRSPERDIFHSSPIHRGATDVGHEWRPFVDSPDLVRTQGRAQRNIPHVLLASVSPWNNGICDPPASDSSLPSFGGLTPPADTEFSLWPQGVYAYEFFTSHPNLVSGGTIFPQDGAPLIQLPYPPYCAAYPIPTVEHTQSNQPPLSSGSRGPPLIVNQDYVRCETLARWGCLNLISLRIRRHSTQHPQAIRTVVTPLSLQTYGWTRFLRDHTAGQEIARNVNRLFSM